MNKGMDELIEAVKRGDGEKADVLGEQMRSALSDDARSTLERALTDKAFLKELLSSDKAKSVMSELEKRGLK